jgi:DNA-binding GntR family transcriptional regulator
MEKFGFSTQDIHKLQSIVEKLGELQEGDDPYAVVSIDMKFHRLLYNRCEHQLLLQVLGSLQSLTRLFILNTKIFQSDLTRDDFSHQTILDSIRSGDPERAEAILKKHIIFAGKSLVDHMKMKSSSKSSTTVEKTT